MRFDSGQLLVEHGYEEIIHWMTHFFLCIVNFTKFQSYCGSQSALKVHLSIRAIKEQSKQKTKYKLFQNMWKYCICIKECTDLEKATSSSCSVGICMWNKIFLSYSNVVHNSNLFPIGTHRRETAISSTLWVLSVL